MFELLHQVFGEGRDLTALQMGARAFVMFFIVLFLIKLSGMRSFASKSAFDYTVVLLLGAILSRAIVGVSAFIPTVTAGLVICLTHRILGILSSRFHLVSNFLKGDDLILYKDGKLIHYSFPLNRFKKSHNL